MASSETDIGNLVLQRLGARAITSFNDGSVGGDALLVAYPARRDSLLEGHAWKFAEKFVQLAADATPPLFGYTNSFRRPADWLRDLPPDHPNYSIPADYRMVGDFIFTDESAPLDYVYVARIENVAKFPPSFVEALVADLAHMLCEKISQSGTKKDRLKQDAEDALVEARRIDGVSKPSQEDPLDTWEAVRYGGGGGGGVGGPPWW